MTDTLDASDRAPHGLRHDWTLAEYYNHNLDTLPKYYQTIITTRTYQDQTQALCFLAGANSIFCGEKLLTTPNPSQDADMRLLERLGLKAAASSKVDAAAAG